MLPFGQEVFQTKAVQTKALILSSLLCKCDAQSQASLVLLQFLEDIGLDEELRYLRAPKASSRRLTSVGKNFDNLRKE